MEKIRKHKIIKKIFIPLLVLGIFLLPVSPSLEKIKTEAAEGDFYYLLYIKDQGNGQKVYGPTESECNAKRTNFINSDTYKNNRNIYLDVSDCIKEEAENINPDTDYENLNNNLDLGCSPWSLNGIYGCVAGIFFLIFKIVAWVASLAGTFLDFLIYYSTSSGSYTSGFITKGWGAVRDIANIFFIVALLYIAIKTILGLNVTNNKKLIGTIVIVALLINFSLFFTQVIIDGSNILAKVFYNNIDSKYENKTSANGAEGEKSISVGLMDKFNPHKILSQSIYDQDGGTTLFIIITIILIGIIIYTAYIFFSVGLLFVSRVVMLWMCMIFAPIAFASYALPFDIPGLGHKEWWKNLFENAFLAPIFIFMLYLIVMFAGFLKEIATFSEGSTFMQKAMSVLIPFVILMVLLMKAKQMAVKYAGEMGTAVVKGGAVIGGLALGGAALGAATLGRNAVGKVMQRASRSDSAAKYEEFKKGNISGSQLSWKDKTFGRMGYGLNKSQGRVEEAQHARHELDKESAARYDGKKFKELSGTERNEILKRVSRDDAAMKKYGKAYKNITQTQKDQIDNVVIPGLTKTKGQEYLEQSKHKQGTRSTLVQAMRTGTWDIRELSKVTASEYDKVNTKFLSGLTSVLGNTMRGSIKSTFGAEYGSSQKHLFKDLGNTISEALKGAKINVDLSHVGKEEKDGHKDKRVHH